MINKISNIEVNDVKRVIFFGDSGSFITSILYEAFIEALDERFELIAVINTTPHVKYQGFLKRFLFYMVKKFFNPFDKNIKFCKYGSFLRHVRNIKLIHAPDINNADFISQIKAMNPNYAFLMGCPQILKKDILSCFDKVINYHNSYLPKYRGLYATMWEMFFEEEYMGYSFHYVNENIDDGNIIYQEKIKINYSKSPLENEIIKTKKAAKNLKKVLDLVYLNYEGRKQVGEPSYFGKKERMKLLTFEKINVKDIRYIQKLINIWGGIYIHSGNSQLFITKIANNGKIKRISYLPPKIYFLYKGIQHQIKRIKERLKRKGKND